MSIKRQSLTCLIFSLFGFSCVQENRRGESLRKQRKSRGKKLEEKTRAFENILSFLNGYPIAWIEMCQISGNSYLKAEPCSGLWEDDGMQWPEIVRSYRIVGTRRNISNVMKFWRTLHFGFDKLLYWIQIQCCKKSFSNILSSDDLMLKRETTLLTLKKFKFLFAKGVCDKSGHDICELRFRSQINSRVQFVFHELFWNWFVSFCFESQIVNESFWFII